MRSHTGGNRTLAAELIGMGLTTLYAKVKKFGLLPFRSCIAPFHFGRMAK